jgi:hypothetical protein
LGWHLSQKDYTRWTKNNKKKKTMYWQNKNDHRKQILVSRCKFSQGHISHISFPIEDLSQENCPILISEFEDYQGIPGGISNKGIEEIKIFFLSKEAYYICFTGITQKAIHV